DDYVLATGEMHTVREFAETAFAQAGIGLEWRGSGRAEHGIDGRTGKVLVAIDPRYYRPTEVDHLVGDASKARKTLGWRATRSFTDIVREMVTNDLALIASEPRRFGEAE
ncbi:MAG TPA: GDP-mannose 4,6-dehydratase, partial [Stellaceae bacterium]|nr:GDP-mannose 4,6-dehydratase [Stellaceae bacterium]